MKREEIDKIVNKISSETGMNFECNKDIAGYRLTCNSGSKDISPRLPKKAFLQWCEAYLEGLYFREWLLTTTLPLDIAIKNELEEDLRAVLKYIKEEHSNPDAVPCLRRAMKKLNML